MKKNIQLCMALLALCGPSLASSGAYAAGVSKTLKTTVNETLLQGYTATPPAGWVQTIQYATASAATAAPQQIAALVSETRITPASNVLPKPAGISLISLATGAIVKKLTLPAAAQIARADCTFPVGAAFTGCQGAFYAATADQALPGRLIVTAFKQTFDPVTRLNGTKVLNYVLDPAATLVSDQWTLVSQSSAPIALFGLPGFNVGTRTPDQKLYLFERSSPTTTGVFEVTNK